MVDEEKLQNDPGTKVAEEVTTPQYTIDAIKDLTKKLSTAQKENDVLKADNRKLTESIVNGQALAVEVPEEKADLNQLRKNLMKEDQTNLEFVSNALKLREAVIKEGGEDPFVPIGSKYTPTQADYERANRVATVLQEMVDDSDGDPAVFLNEYQRRVKK